MASIWLHSCIFLNKSKKKYINKSVFLNNHGLLSSIFMHTIGLDTSPVCDAGSLNLRIDISENFHQTTAQESEGLMKDI